MLTLLTESATAAPACNDILARASNDWPIAFILVGGMFAFVWFLKD